eukprot:4193068-Amphidinium_carterae.1
MFCWDCTEERGSVLVVSRQGSRLLEGVPRRLLCYLYSHVVLSALFPSLGCPVLGLMHNAIGFEFECATTALAANQTMV